MYQQQNRLGQQSSGQMQHFHLQELDAANLVLSELKRAAREYMTAALESTHSAIRQTFASLAQKTLQDQAELFHVLSQMQGYGSVKMASQQEVQQELQQQIRKAEQLQTLVHQAVQSSYASAAGMYQQQPQPQQPYTMPSPSYAQPPSYASGYGSGSTGYGSQGAAASGMTSGYGGQGTASSGNAAGYGASYTEQGFSQIGSPSYDPSVSAGIKHAGSASQEDDAPKSSVSGTDQPEYYSARSAQDYTGNTFSSGSIHEGYGTNRHHEQTYASSGHSSAARQSGSYGFVGSAGHGSETSMSTGSSSADGSSKNKQHRGSGSSHNSKYMM